MLQEATLQSSRPIASNRYKDPPAQAQNYIRLCVVQEAALQSSRPIASNGFKVSSTQANSGLGMSPNILTLCPTPVLYSVLEEANNAIEATKSFAKGKKSCSALQSNAMMPLTIASVRVS